MSLPAGEFNWIALFRILAGSYKQFANACLFEKTFNAPNVSMPGK
jgi:hypothetical protein